MIQSLLVMAFSTGAVTVYVGDTVKTLQCIADMRYRLTSAAQLASVRKFPDRTLKLLLTWHEVQS